MSNVIFTYNEESALAAGAGGFINEGGAYIITITEAELKCNTNNQARWIEFSGEAEDGRKIQYLSVYSVKKDGAPNTFGENMIHAMMDVPVSASSQITWSPPVNLSPLNLPENVLVWCCKRFFAVSRMAAIPTAWKYAFLLLLIPVRH